MAGKKEAQPNTAELDEDAVVEDELEKALDLALESLQKSDGPSGENGDEDDEEDEEDEEGEDYEKMEKKKKKVAKSKREPDYPNLSKSLHNSIEEDADASEVMDAVPFMKALVDTLEDQLTEMTKAVVHVGEKMEDLVSRVEDVEEVTLKSRKLDIAQAKLIKSINSEIKTIGDAPQPTKSFLGKNLSIMRKSSGNEGAKEMSLSPVQVMNKLTALHKSNKISLDQVVKAEGRLQKGQPLPEEVTQLIAIAE